MLFFTLSMVISRDIMEKERTQTPLDWNCTDMGYCNDLDVRQPIVRFMVKRRNCCSLRMRLVCQCFKYAGGLFLKGLSRRSTTSNLHLKYESSSKTWDLNKDRVVMHVRWSLYKYKYKYNNDWECAWTSAVRNCQTLRGGTVSNRPSRYYGAGVGQLEVPFWLRKFCKTLLLSSVRS